jgi:hypothetical protein
MTAPVVEERMPADSSETLQYAFDFYFGEMRRRPGELPAYLQVVKVIADANRKRYPEVVGQYRDRIQQIERELSAVA